MTHGAIPGRLPSAPVEYNQQWANQLVDQLERIHRLLNRAISTGWTLTNVTATRTLDADSTTLAEVADVLGTLIDDMKERGMTSD